MTITPVYTENLTLSIVSSAGEVIAKGDAVYDGQWTGPKLTSPIVGMATDGKGYWLVAADGTVFPFGTPTLGFPTGLAQSVLTITATPSGSGYWITTTGGQVFPYGDAAALGDTATSGRKAIDMATTPSGKGYWLLMEDGGIPQYGDASFYGTTANMRLNSGSVAIAATPTGKRYWEATQDGQIIAFGDATTLIVH